VGALRDVRASRGIPGPHGASPLCAQPERLFVGSGGFGINYSQHCIDIFFCLPLFLISCFYNSQIYSSSCLIWAIAA
jgi:hypothetical protein